MFGIFKSLKRRRTRNGERIVGGVRRQQVSTTLGTASISDLPPIQQHAVAHPLAPQHDHGVGSASGSGNAANLLCQGTEHENLTDTDTGSSIDSLTRTSPNIMATFRTRNKVFKTTKAETSGSHYQKTASHRKYEEFASQTTPSLYTQDEHELSTVHIRNANMLWGFSTSATTSHRKYEEFSSQTTPRLYTQHEHVESVSQTTPSLYTQHEHVESVSQTTPSLCTQDEQELSTVHVRNAKNLWGFLTSAKSMYDWAFLPCRKFFYFKLSKPSHGDVESLSWMSFLGKKKVLFMLFLPLLWYLVTCAQKNQGYQNFMDNLSSPSWNGNYFSIWIPRLEGFRNDPIELKIDQLKKTIPEISGDLRGRVRSNIQARNWEIKAMIRNILYTEFMPMVKDEQKRMSDDMRRELKEFIKDIFQKEFHTFMTSEVSRTEFLHNSFDRVDEEIRRINKHYETVTHSVDQLVENYGKLTEQSQSSATYFSDQNLKLDEFQSSLKNVEARLTIFETLLKEAKSCCLNSTQLETYFANFLLQLTVGDSKNPALHSFKTWLSTMFVNGQQLRKEIDKARASISKEHEFSAEVADNHLEQRLKAVESKFSAELKDWLKEDNVTSFSFLDSRVQEIVKRAIVLYDSDKTGQTDYALESGGAAVVNTRCSETYSEGRPSVILFGIRLWNMMSSPRYAIQPDMHPGQCWAFRGSQGFLVIELSARIRPTGFVIEHIAKSLSPAGSINSAPQKFSIWGLDSEKDTQGQILGEYSYDIEGEPLQYFKVQNEDGIFYSYVELKILSNHGDAKYTCLYRFRVHGIRE